MHIFVLILMMSIFGHDAMAGSIAVRLPAGQMVLMALLPLFFFGLMVAMHCRRVTKLLAVEGASLSKPLYRLEQHMLVVRLLALASWFGCLYGLGWLQWVRRVIGDWVLIDELVAMLPTLLLFALPWWFYFPIEKGLRNRSSDADSAGSRAYYLLMQVRHQILIVFVPVVIILAWSETLVFLATGNEAIARWHDSLSLLGFVVVFAMAPLIVRWVWRTEPLRESGLRDRLLGMCREYRVRVLELLEWHTYGNAINGAVIGIVGPVRYIMLTDGLLARMNTMEIEAVMAHEIGHVKRRHMIWLVLCAMATLYFVEAILFETVLAADRWLPDWLRETYILDGCLFSILIASWLWMFGWVSRRFERQADTFAVQHLSRKYPEASQTASIVRSGAVQVYVQALHNVAQLNGMSIDREGWRSWRHGSIRWRCEYLHTLIGQPLDQCEIDHTVRRILRITVGILLTLLLYHNLDALVQWYAAR